MTPEQKTKELVSMFTSHAYHSGSIEQCKGHAKACATICVNEILKSYKYNIDIGWIGSVQYDNIKYWESVKEEILKQ